jgi:DNA-binding beta-propeller fold protein YncE
MSFVIPIPLVLGQDDMTGNPGITDIYGPPEQSSEQEIKSSLFDSNRFANTRLPFIENQGQINGDVKFYTNTFAGTVYVTDNDLTYHSTTDNPDSKYNAIIIKEKFLGKINPTGLDKKDTVVNYFKGSEENWKTNIPTYDLVDLGFVWPSINVKLKSYGNNIEKIFTVQPKGSVNDIIIRFDGITDLSIAENGELVVNTDLGSISLSKPIAYQDIDGKRNEVLVGYNIIDSTTYGFSVNSYDPRYDLIIDPLLASTFIGSNGGIDGSNAITLDDTGNVYITGSTPNVGTDLPTTVGAYDTTHNGGSDVFVSKFDSGLTTLMASTFIGGDGTDIATGITLDGSGTGTTVYITGITTDGTIDFPTTVGAYDTTHNTVGGSDAFVSKFNSGLTALIASTFIGGSGADEGQGITLDGSGNVYITGLTADDVTDLPTTVGAYDTTNNGIQDVFVSKFDSGLTTLMASTFIGGSGGDFAESITLDGSGNVYITGLTADDVTDLPTTVGAYDTTHNGAAFFNDVFVSKFDSGLTTLMASTFIGGDNDDKGLAITLDSTGNVYITGTTTDGTIDFPTTVGAYDTTHNSAADVFVSKFDSGLTTLSASTFIGGDAGEQGQDITLDGTGHVYVTGRTLNSAIDFPTTVGAYDTTHNSVGGSNDVFVSKFDSGLTTLSASTFIGGDNEDRGLAITLDGTGNVYITGTTTDDTIDFPTTVGAYDTTHNGPALSVDVFVSKFDSNLSDPISLNSLVYDPSNTVIVTVTDSAANLSALALDTVIVDAFSDTDGGGIMRTLFETGVNTGIFSGTFGLTTGPSTPSILQVTVGDTLTVSYGSFNALASIVANAPPILDYPSQTVNSGSLVTLSGTATDSEPLLFSWTQLSGPPVSISSLNLQNPTFTAPPVGSPTLLQFQVTVTDGGNPPVQTTVMITVNPIPIQLDSDQYEVNTGGVVTVTNSTANLSPAVIDTVSVLMNSTTDETGFSVILTETDVDTGIFVSPQIIFSSAATDAGLNILNAPEGSTVFANYNIQRDSASIVCTGCTGGVLATPPAVRFNSDIYEHETSGQLNIDDSSKNLNTAAVDTFTVNVKSALTPAGIPVTMVEDAVNSAKFVSSPLITFTRIAGGPSSYLLVNNLDTVMLTAPYTVSAVSFNPTASIVSPFQPAQPGNIVGPAPPALACNNDVDGNGNSDNDNDGICDLWEFQGGAHSGNHRGLEITFGGDFYQYVDENDGVTCKPLIDDPAASAADDSAYGTLDDTPFCPDPNKKDIFVEIDYMTGHKPDAAALRKVVEAFATAPSTGNPAGVGPGINLHLLVDGDIGFHQISLPEDAVVSVANPHGGFKQIKQSNFMTAPERQGLAGDIADILTAKRQVFHYVLYVHNNADNPGSGVAERGGNDVIMSLGEFDNHLGSPDQQQGTLLHELGHNLNLRHGGNVDTPVCKPNYVSVMNYGFQMSNIVPGRPLDFSRSDLPMMNEASLSEPVGFARTSPPGLQTVYGGVSNTNTALSLVVAKTNDATIGLTVNATHVLVTDPGNNRIQVMNPVFATPVTYGGTAGTGNAQYKSPEGIATGAVSGTKFIYVADTANNRIKKLSSSAVFVAKIPNVSGGAAGTGNTQFNSPEGISFSGSSLYIADTGNHRIKKIHAGTLAFEAKLPNVATPFAGSGNGEFKSPWGVAVDGTNLFVADTGNHRIQKFTISGNTFTFSGKVPNMATPTAGSGDGNFTSPRGIAVANNVVYVADTGNNRIQKFDATTLAYLGQFGSPGTTDGLLNSPEGIAVNSTGNIIYVADTGNTRIQKFDNNGVFLAKIGSAGTAAGQFSINTPIGYNFNRQVSGTTVTDTGVSQPIHVLGISGCVPSAPIPGVFSTTPRVNIYGYNDWANLDLFFRDDALFSDGFSDFDTLDELTPGDNNVLLSSTIIAIDELLFSFEENADFVPVDDGLIAQDAIHIDLLDANNLIISGDLEGAILLLDGDVRNGILTLQLVQDDPELFDAEDIRTELLILLDTAIAALNSSTEDAIVSQIFADDDSATTNQGAPVDILVLTNDGNEGAGTISIASFTQGAIGGVTNIGGDVLRYMPNAGQSGPDSFTYTISNGLGQEDSATVTITITPVAPQFNLKWGKYGTGNTQFKSPIGIDVDSTGKVYVTDSGNNRIQKFTISGNNVAFAGKWGSYGTGNTQFNNPSSLHIGLADKVYVTDSGNNRIKKFDSAGAFILQWGSSGTTVGKFKNPTGIGIDSADKVYVSDSDNNRIQKFSNTGGFPSTWGTSGTGDGQFKKPRGVAVDSAGNVYVADSVNNRIQKFTSAGVFILQWGTTGTLNGQFKNPTGVDVDSFGNVYVVDTDNNRIQKFDGTGTFIVKWGSFGTGNGQFKNPLGIAVDSAGNIYIGDTGNHRVQKFVP